MKVARVANATLVACYTCGNYHPSVVAAKHYFRLQAAGSKKCLEIYEYNTNYGRDLVSWECHNDNNQKWTTDSADGFIRSGLDNNICIDPEGPSTATNTVLQIWGCIDHYSFHKWIITPYGQLQPNRRKSQCATDNGSGKNGGKVTLKRCDKTYSNPNQIWLDPGDYTQLKTVVNSCIGIANYDLSNGKDLILVNNCDASQSTLSWYMDPDGYIHSQHRFTKCMHVDSVSVDAPVKISDCNRSKPNQKFKWDDYRLQAASDDRLCVEAVAGNGLRLASCVGGRYAQIFNPPSTFTDFRAMISFSRQCMEMAVSEDSNNWGLQLSANCNGKDEQLWYRDAQGYIHNKRLYSKCLHVDDIRENRKLTVADCDLSNKNQRFEWRGYQVGTTQFDAVGFNLFLRVTGNGVYLASYAHDRRQLFNIPERCRVSNACFDKGDGTYQDSRTATSALTETGGQVTKRAERAKDGSGGPPPIELEEFSLAKAGETCNYNFDCESSYCFLLDRNSSVCKDLKDLDKFDWCQEDPEIATFCVRPWPPVISSESSESKGADGQECQSNNDCSSAYCVDGDSGNECKETVGEYDQCWEDEYNLSLCSD